MGEYVTDPRDMIDRWKDAFDMQIPTKSPAYSDLNAPTIPILIRAPFRDIPAHFRGLADEQS
jgi:hypothetical protein